MGRTIVAVSILLAVVFGVGCRSARVIRDPDFAQLESGTTRSWESPDPVTEAMAPEAPRWEGAHPVEDYIALALNQNPEIHAVRKRIEALALQVPVAASLQDPTLGVTVLPEPVQTAAGQQEMILSVAQKFPWFGKLAARASAAEAAANVARAELAAKELDTISRVKRAYYELYYVQQAIKVTQTEQDLLAQIRDVANARYKAGRVSQQDVLRADLEISDVEKSLIRLQQQLESRQAALARLLHISANSNVLAQDTLPDEIVPRDIDLLQRRAIAARPELHAKLAAIERDRQAVELAQLDYRPDVTLGLSWIDMSRSGISPVANGRDAFLLSAGVNLPIYRKRLDAAVRSAEAKIVSTAREYDALKDLTLEQIADLFAQARSQAELIKLFRGDILPKARQTLEVSRQAYNVGEVDFLQLIDNWRTLLRYEIGLLRLEASLRQTIAELERIVGGFTGEMQQGIVVPGRAGPPQANRANAR